MLSTTSPASLQEPFINTVLRNSILIKERIALALAELKQLQNGNGDLNGVMANHGSRKSSRGRKSMGAQEREEVSLRMKRYWASRRGYWR